MKKTNIKKEIENARMILTEVIDDLKTAIVTSKVSVYERSEWESKEYVLSEAAKKFLFQQYEYLEMLDRKICAQIYGKRS